MIDNITDDIIEKNKDNVINILNHINIGVKFNKSFLNLFIQRMINDKIVKPKYTFNNSYTLTKEQQNIFKQKDTTIGKFIFNAFILPIEYINKFGFINETIKKDVYETLHSNLALLVSSKTITPEVYSDCLDRLIWLGMNLTNFKGYSMDLDSLSVDKNFKEKTKKVYQNLKNNNASNKDILEEEDKLVNELKEKKKNSGLSKIISMGAKGNFENNYKNLLVGRGLVNKADGSFELLETNLNDGNNIKNYLALSNNSIAGSFSRSIKTALGGYLTKLVIAGFSYLIISPNEECGTPYSLKRKITKNNYKAYLYRLMSTSKNGKLIELNLENYKDFIDKEVYIRSPLYCKNKTGICKNCFGNLWKYNNITKGLAVLITDLSSKIMNTSMKAFHDLTISYSEVEIDKYF